VLNDEPIRADGTAMADSETLSNGYCLETDGEVDALAERLEALVIQAGLRVMLSDDWDNTGRV
jgi:hypothetical protein